MVRYQKIKYALACLCALALALFALTYFVRPVQQKVQTSQASNEYLINVSLVKTTVVLSNGKYDVATSVTDEQVADVNNNDTVILNNAGAYEIATGNKDFGTGIETQAISINMGTSDSTTDFALLKVSATFNGKGIDISSVGTDNKFTQYIFGLPDEFSTSDAGTTSTKINDSNGQYVFKYTYRTRNATTGVETENNGEFKFNVLTTTYLDKTGTSNAWDYENTFKFTTESESATNTQNVATQSAERDDADLYFNYNNHTYNKSGGNSNTPLEMPTVRYDARKYNLSYTRKVYNSIESVTSQMAVRVENGVTKAVITFSSTLDGKTETFNYPIDDLDNSPFVELTFEDIGEYSFAMSPLTRVDDTTFLNVANSNPSLLGAQNISRNLTVFGYQLKYADDVTNSSELRNAELGLYADITTFNYKKMSSSIVTKNGNNETQDIANLEFFKKTTTNPATSVESTIVIPSTNQAPLWFDYIGTLSSNYASKYLYYTNLSTLDINNIANVTPTKIGTYKKGEYFMDAGLYIVEINYTLPNTTYTKVFKQYFAFIIENTAPTAEIIALGGTENENATLYNDSYTNKNVAIKWDESNPFNARVSASYSRYNFENTLVEENVNINKYGSTNQTILSNNGKYYVRLSYGRLGTSYTAWEFTIDKIGISGLKIEFDNLGSTLDAVSTSVVNNPFTLLWDAKASGAQITLEHQKMLIVKDDDYQVNDLNNLVCVGNDASGNKIYALKNGYKTSTISSSVKYENITQFDVLQYALHLFKLRDSAGNELYYSILLDNTNPAYIFSPKIDNDFNLVDETTTVVWGASKAIAFSAPTADDSALFDYFKTNDLLISLCDTVNGILNVPFASTVVSCAPTESALFESELPQSSPAMQVVVDKTNNTITPYASTIDTSSGELVVTNSAKPIVSSINSLTYEEYYFKVEIFDQSTVASKLKTTGHSTTRLEINLDASQVLAFTNPSSSSEKTTEVRLYNGSASNRDKLFIEYFAERNGYKVESLKLEFYPLAMDKTLETYPYTNSPSLEFNLLASATTNVKTSKKQTIYFNLGYDSALQKQVTQTGKYVVTRVYEYNTALFESEDDARRTKTYTFYIDRNNIVQNITLDYPIKVGDKEEVYTRTVGEYIKLKLGDKNTQYVEFDDLLLSADNSNVILTTDVFPINAVVPKNKYSVIENTDKTYTNINSFSIQLEVYYKQKSATDEKFVSIISISGNKSTEIVNELLKISPEIFQKNGIYKFVLSDFTGYSTNGENGSWIENNEPNKFEFRIEISKEAPSGKYYRNPNSDGSENEIIRTTSGSTSGEVASTSDDELKFVFEDSNDVYKAKVNYTDVLVTRRTKGSTKFETAVKVTFEDMTTVEGKITYPSSADITSLASVKGYREIKKDSNGNQVTDSNGNPIYKYTIILPTKNNSGSYYEGEYRVTIHYYGDENYYIEKSEKTTISYYTSEVDVVLDKTAPNFNILRLLAYDKYLPETSADPNVVSKENIVQYVKNQLDSDSQAELKERVRQFLRNYAFALPSDFKFFYATNDGYPIGYYDDYTYYEHDTSSLYVRKYNKYSKTDPLADQSYIKTDPEFGSTTGVLNFGIGRDEYKSVGYANSKGVNNPFRDIVGVDEKEDSYYEIIEIDQAGNQRIYTVYIKSTATTVKFSDGSTGENAITYTGNAENNSLSLGYDYKITSIENLDCYTRISLYDKTSKSTLIATYDITPTTNIDDIISAINARISNKVGYENTGARYTLKFLNRYGENFEVSVQRPGEELTYKIQEATLTFKITLPSSTSSTWITKFIVKQYDEKTKQIIELTSDLNGAISDTLFDGVEYTFNRGEYYFYLIDNFERGINQPIHYIFNIVDSKDLVFAGTQIDNTTAKDVYFTYQTKLYSAKIYVNDTLVDTNDITATTFEGYDNITSLYNQAYFTRQFTFKALNNTKTTYKIVLSYNTSGVDIVTQDIVFNFTIDTILPSFELTDLNGNNMNYLLTSLGSSTSKEINISWNDPTNYPVTVTLDRVYDGKTTTTTLSKNYSIYLEGQYTLRMTNTLGNSIEYTFAVSQNSAILYDVYANGAKIEASARSVLFNFSGAYNDEAFDINEYIKVYTSIYALSVIANEKKDLQAKLVYSYTSNNIYKLDIYKIYGSNTLYYSEYIALLQLDKSILKIENFVIGETEDVVSAVTGISNTYYSKSLYATWEKAFEINVQGFGNIVFEDFIKVRVYYNGVYVNEFTTNNLTFSDSGEYRLKFSDVAGYTYLFSRGQVNSEYYTIDLLNSVSFKVNDGEPINHAIYNDKVTLQPTNTSRYDHGSFAMTVYYKGVAYPARDYYKSTAYVFTEYGDYTIKMSAKINGQDVVSVYDFKIFSKNEANRSFVFSQLDGFEVVSIVKSGVDITDTIKEEQNTTKLMAFEFSSEQGQTGVYEVNVKVTNSGLKPTQNFAFTFWINDADVNLIPSIPFGTSTTSKITIKLNKYAIHQELGNVVLKITGMNDILINDQTAQTNEISSITLSENITYTIQVYSESGTLLQSYVITKDEPLNAVAIIVIIVSVIVVVGAVVLFIVFRTRMKVR